VAALFSKSESALLAKLIAFALPAGTTGLHVSILDDSSERDNSVRPSETAIT